MSEKTTPIVDYSDLEFKQGSGVHIWDEVIYPWFVHAETLDAMSDFQVRHDDVYVISYPKSGTTWTQEIVSLINSNGEPDSVKDKHVEERVPHLEMSTAIPGTILYPRITAMPDDKPRLIKTHLPYQHMPKDFLVKKPKIVYIARNYKDVSVSGYSFLRMYKAYDDVGSWNDFCQGVLLKELTPYGPWTAHVLGWWQHRRDKNVLFLKYEDLKKDLRGGVIQIADFLGKPLSDEAIDKTVEHCSFKTMSRNPMTNFTGLDAFDHKVSSFMRKGGTGDWKNWYTVAQNEAMSKLIEERIQGSGLEFDYEPAI
ncbi:sulfotransferase 1E1-like [Anneissia japonica]|uniref:sulfotransferase 1E1-like n=1 Tax=Anneissia japonica TaxID=1529436 RepID=UPI00142588E0|nr:sulfotransferase 1E1-like [Anneissia japonica]XP_033099687.1 sulfotransferase 1E1-like [Anneissia japonica]